jgi:hypothetical protein
MIRTVQDLIDELAAGVRDGRWSADEPVRSVTYDGRVGDNLVIDDTRLIVDDVTYPAYVLILSN